jgi:hypothetical protein
MINDKWFLGLNEWKILILKDNYNYTQSKSQQRIRKSYFVKS